MSDTSPGAIAKINGQAFRLYNTVVLPLYPLSSKFSKPGEIVAYANEAVRIQGKDGEAVWVSILKKVEKGSTPNIKLPATSLIDPKILSTVLDLSKDLACGF